MSHHGCSMLCSGFIIAGFDESGKFQAVRTSLSLSVTQILDAMNQDSGIPLEQLLVDGGMTSNRLLMQLQADILCIPVGTRSHTSQGGALRTWSSQNRKGAISCVLFASASAPHHGGDHGPGGGHGCGRGRGGGRLGPDRRSSSPGRVRDL